MRDDPIEENSRRREIMIYVDDAETGWGRGVWSHMWSDASDEELHEFAERIGMRREWHQSPPKAKWSHYDVPTFRRAMAIMAGAKVVNRREAVLHRKWQLTTRPANLP
jgi:hypothetical protein